MPGTYRVPEIAHDHAHARTVVVDIDDSNLGVTYVFDGTSWATPANAATPPLFTTAIGPTPDGLVMFSGFDLAAGGFSEATWTWNGFVWTNRSPAHHPAGRVYAAMAYDPIRKVTLLFGGGDSATAFRDTWSWDGSDWTEVTDVGPDARASAALAWNPYRRRMMLFGGTSSAPLADLFELDGSQWSPVAVSSQAPAPRADAVLVPESTSGSMLVFAGVERSGNALDDLWRIGWASDRTTDDCRNATDLDGDALAGCADPDCYYLCSPACTPGPDLATCATMGPRCGDTSCSALETCRLCPADCGVCTATCGDSFCDPGETATSCPGDC